MNPAYLKVHRPTAHLVLTALGLAGVVALFLPFAFGVTPPRAWADWGIWQLALPAFLPTVIVVAGVRWVRSGRLSRPEQLIGYVVGAASAIATLAFYLTIEDWPSDALTWLSLGAPVVILGFGIRAVARIRQTQEGSEYGPIMALQVAYIANAMLALIAWFHEWQAGAYCVLATVVAYALQIDLMRHAPSQLTGESTS
jgi:hypothetical protein